jgi:hypothetical protein
MGKKSNNENVAEIKLNSTVVIIHPKVHGKATKTIPSIATMLSIGSQILEYFLLKRVSDRWNCLSSDKDESLT